MMYLLLCLPNYEQNRANFLSVEGGASEIGSCILAESKIPDVILQMTPVSTYVCVYAGTL